MPKRGKAKLPTEFMENAQRLREGKRPKRSSGKKTSRSSKKSKTRR